METDVLALFDDGLHVAVGLNGRGVTGWVERGNAVEEAVVDGAPFAKTLDGVVFDAGFGVESDFGIDAVDLGGSQRSVGKSEEMCEKCAAISGVFALVVGSLGEVSDKPQDGVSEFEIP